MAGSISKTLIAQGKRIRGIMADETQSPARKADFFRQFMPFVQNNNDIVVTEGIYRQAQNKYNETLPKSKELSTHQGILLAQSLKEASHSDRLLMVASDPGYLTILNDMPHTFFGIDERVYAELIDYAAAVSATPEQFEQAETLENDLIQIEALKAAKTGLVDEMAAYVKTAMPEVKKADFTAHLYQL
jgi:hypothetical protein